jgi:hypothetical protein
MFLPHGGAVLLLVREHGMMEEAELVFMKRTIDNVFDLVARMCIDIIHYLVGFFRWIKLVLHHPVGPVALQDALVYDMRGEGLLVEAELTWLDLQAVHLKWLGLVDKIFGSYRIRWQFCFVV